MSEPGFDKTNTYAMAFDPLRYAEERFQILAQGIPDSCFFVNTDLEIEFANYEFAQPLGTTVTELLHRRLADVLGAREHAAREAHLRKALAGEHVVYELEAEPKAGGPRYLRVSDKPIVDGEGEVKGVLSTATDISASKRLESEARRNEARFRMIAEGVPNHLLFLDRELRIEFANDVFLDAAGWSLESAVGSHISEVVGEERFQQRLQYYEQALSGQPVSYEATGAAGSKSGFFRFEYRPALDSSGEVCGLFSMAIDISRRRVAELALEAKQRELVRSNRDLEQFAYVASHDLKAPLRAIEHLVEWISEELEEHDIGDVKENLGLLAQRTTRLNRLLDDLLSYSRAGRKVGAVAMTNCEELVKDVIALVNPPDGMSIEVAGPLPELETYPVPLQQVLLNLASNAIKHHPGPAGSVVISCEEHEDHYVFSVKDDGEGIPEEYQDRVFEMFQTLQPRDRVEGSGMGLAIVNRIVTWQGGRAWFESPTPDGPGTVFRFEWCKRYPQNEELEK